MRGRPSGQDNRRAPKRHKRRSNGCKGDLGGEHHANLRLNTGLRQSLAQVPISKGIDCEGVVNSGEQGHRDINSNSIFVLYFLTWNRAASSPLSNKTTRAALTSKSFPNTFRQSLYRLFTYANLTSNSP